jgi:glycopeptide antibiotics resistance protein
MKIVKVKLGYLSLFPLFGIGLIFLVRYFRENTQPPYIIAYALSSAPNLIAAFFQTPACLSFFWSIFSKSSNDYLWFFISAFVNLLIVLGWEFCQLRLNYWVFDINDIIASFLGSLLFLFCWPLIRRFKPLT